MWDAAVVGAGELVGRARSGDPRGAVGLVAVIETVVVAVAAPSGGHAVFVGTGEGRRGAGAVWRTKRGVKWIVQKGLIYK